MKEEYIIKNQYVIMELIKYGTKGIRYFVIEKFFSLAF